MEEIATVPVKIECFPSNHLKAESTEQCMEEAKFLDQTAKNGLPSSNGMSAITVMPSTSLSIPVSSQNYSSGHATVVAQIAPMTSVVRNAMEQDANSSLGAMQTALLMNKAAPDQELELRNECVVATSSPVTVTVVPSVVTANTTLSNVGCSSRNNSNPNHIKRPMNAFLIWSTARRHKIKLEEPNITMAEISKRLGEEWKNMGFDERQPFVDQSKQLREEHMAKYPNYKYQPRRRNTLKSANGNFAPVTGKIKSIKSQPSIYPSTTSADLSFQQQQPRQQQPQQDPQQQSHLQGRHQGFQGVVGHQEHQLIFATSAPSITTTSLSSHSLQQEPQSSTADVLAQHQNMPVNNNTSQQQPISQSPQQAQPMQQPQQQQQIQSVNGNLLSTSTQQVNQWPATIYPGLTLMGYHMTSNGMVPLYAPTQPMLPVISLPTAQVGTVLQPNNSATVIATSGQQPQMQQLPEQRHAILSIDSLAGSMNIKSEIQSEAKTNPSDSMPQSTQGRDTSPIIDSDEATKEDSKQPAGEVLPFAHI